MSQGGPSIAPGARAPSSLLWGLVCGIRRARDRGARGAVGILMTFARGVCSLVLLAVGVLGCKRVEPVTAVDDPPGTVAPSAFTGARAGDEREVYGIKFCWCPPGKFLMG